MAVMMMTTSASLTGCEKSVVRYCSSVLVRSDPSGWVIFSLQVARLANHVWYPFIRKELFFKFRK